MNIDDIRPNEHEFESNVLATLASETISGDNKSLGKEMSGLVGLINKDMKRFHDALKLLEEVSSLLKSGGDAQEAIKLYMSKPTHQLGNVESNLTQLRKVSSFLLKQTNEKE